jgi:pre-mRNA-splicing factor SYF1
VFNGSSPDHFSHAQVVETYNEALEKINPRKAVGPLYPLYVNFAKFYEEGGSKNAETGEPNNAPDLDAARKIFEKATRVPYKTVDELAEVWCEWAEMELRHEYVWKVGCGGHVGHSLRLSPVDRNYEEAIRLMQRATSTPKNTKINYYDEVRRNTSGQHLHG